MLLRRPDGSVRILDGGDRHAGRGRRRHRSGSRWSSRCRRGSTLIAYTDGLIERPGHDMDEGIHELCERVMRAPRDADPRALCDVAVSGALDHRDDVALIAVRFD